MPLHGSASSSAELHNPRGVGAVPLDLTDNDTTAYRIRRDNGSTYPSLFYISTQTSNVTITLGNSTDNPAIVATTAGFIVDTPQSTSAVFLVRRGTGDPIFQIDTAATSSPHAVRLREAYLSADEIPSEPTAVANQVHVYAYDNGGTTELRARTTDGTVNLLDVGGATTGTANLSWTVNEDAVAASNEDPHLVLLGGDGVAAPNNDLVRTVVTQDSTAESVTFEVERSRNGGAYANVQPLYILEPGASAEQPATLSFGGQAVAIATTKLAMDGGIVISTGSSVVLNDGAGGSTLVVGIGVTDLEVFDRSVAIGNSVYARGVEQVVIGNGANTALLTSDYAVAIGAAANAIESSTVAVGSTASAEGAGSVSIGAGTISQSSGAVAIGNTASAANSGIALGSAASGAGLTAIAIGPSCDASGDNSSAIGQTAEASAASSIAIGNGPIAEGADSIAIGANSRVKTAGAISIGSGAGTLTGTQGIAIGESALASAVQTVALGYDPTASGSQSVAIGNSALSSGTESIAIGDDPTASGVGAIAIGTSASATGASAIGLGELTSSTGAAGIAIGQSAAVTHANSVALGRNAASTAANQLVLGSASYALSSVFVGRGVTSATTGTALVTGTGGSGTNIAGHTLQVRGGISTGNAVPGPIQHLVASRGSSGSTVQSTFVAHGLEHHSAVTSQASANGVVGHLYRSEDVTDAQHYAFHVRGNVANATPFQLLEIDLANFASGTMLTSAGSGVIWCRVIASGVYTGTRYSALYRNAARFEVNGTTLSLIDTGNQQHEVAPLEDDNSWDSEITASGNTLRVTCTGDADHATGWHADVWISFTRDGA